MLFKGCNYNLLYSCILSKTGVIFSSFAISVFVLQSVQVYPAVFLICFITAPVVVLASLATVVHFSLLCNRAERASVLYYCFL